MSLLSTNGASYIRNSTGLYVTQPFSFGFWFRSPSIGTTEAIAGVGDFGTAHDWIQIQKTSAALECGRTDISTSDTFTIGTIAADAWNFVLLRAIGTANFRGSCLTDAGVISHGSSTASITSSLATLAIGTSPTFGGANTIATGFRIAEFWYASGDIFPGGGALPDEWVQQLAYSGPFSFPHIASSLIDYKSFRTYAGVGQLNQLDASRDSYRSIAVDEPVWSQLGTGLSTGDHPALQPNYIRPRQTKKLLTL